MCDPMTIGAGIALLAGTAAQQYGQDKSERAVVNMRRAEDARQEGYRGEAEAGLRKNMAATSREAIDSGMASSVKSREAAYRAANAQAPHATTQVASGSLGGNKVVSDSLAQMLDEVGRRVAQQGNARARLGSFGDAMFDASILTGRGRQQIGQAGNFAAGSLKPLGMEMEAASHKGDKARALGTLLTTVGTAMLGAGGAAAGAGAGTGVVTNASAGMMAQPFMQTLPASTFGAGWLAPVAAL